MALLLAGQRWHRPVYGRTHRGGAAAANGDEHAYRQHGWFLRRRTVERAGDQRPYRFYRSHFAGHLAGTPGKILGTRSEWVERNPNTARALVAAVLDAARWIDASEENKRETARILAKRAWLNTKEQYLTGRMLGEYDNGLGQRWQDAHPIRFYDQGEVSFPWLSDGMWFLTQFRRWGLLKTAPDYQAVAGRINRIDVWKEAAQAVGGISTPAALMRSSTLIDGTVWTGADPEGYARGFAIQRKGA